ncbi:MAG: type III-B CRISPR-associated protein Cas10/Cmr2 [Acidobacteria bacterium]|nr:type III-B CRISPR-associated protein Cas10/Cmr2 [Acidobacteriota bacterium]
MIPPKTLHFTLGPVQGFVAQARRTRDLWAGSYLLSYLAGCAMKALVDESKTKGYSGKVIVSPDIERGPLYQAIAGGKKPGKTDDASQVGSLPNRFKAKVPDGVDGSVCMEAIRKKWGDDIAQAVKQELAKVLEAASLDKINDDMWWRQIHHHWDCNWVISDDDSALDIRKNLRNHHTPPEPGEKCTVCGERQELSGKGLGTKDSRDDMRAWWNSLREELKNPERPRKSTLFDLKQGERLCAVCLVKRAFVFPVIAKNEKVIGWEVPVNYPSTSYMAAVGWIIRVFEECKGANAADVKAKVDTFVEAADRAGVWYSEMTAGIEGVIRAGKDSGLDKYVGITRDSGKLGKEPLWKAFAALDGGVFFESVIKNEKEFEVEEEPGKPGERRQQLSEALKSLHDALPPPKPGQSRKATPFYALLFMDGDGMGKLLSAYKDKQAEISTALAQFTQAVPDIVKGSNGRLIYAGADDVFALLPLDKAINCARLCRKAYIQAFDDQFGGPGKRRVEVPQECETTISAAIEYAHMQTALGVVVKDAHQLLDEVAKDGCGRDGLACRVWKRGGPVLTWAQPWKHVLKVKTQPRPPIELDTLVDEVKYLFQDPSTDAGKFSSKFFYKLRDLFELLTANDGKLTLEEDAARRILVTEYLANREIKDSSDKQKQLKLADERVARLLALCQAHKRDMDDNGKAKASDSYSAYGALLIRFLVQKEV